MVWVPPSPPPGLWGWPWLCAGVWLVMQSWENPALNLLLFAWGLCWRSGLCHLLGPTHLTSNLPQLWLTHVAITSSCSSCPGTVWGRTPWWGGRCPAGPASFPALEEPLVLGAHQQLCSPCWEAQSVSFSYKTLGVAPRASWFKNFCV